MPKQSSLAAMRWNKEHQPLVNERIKATKAKNPEKYKAIEAAWRNKHAAELKAKRAEYRKANPEKEKAWRDNYCNSEGGKEYRRLAGKERYRKLRRAVLEAYGGECPHCACCGDRHEEFLTIDHINNDGAKDRREGKRGIGFYTWLINSGFPSGYRVLCMNCNFSLGMRGYCPHKQHGES
jgi:hypothetical protein